MSHPSEKDNIRKTWHWNFRSKTSDWLVTEITQTWSYRPQPSLFQKHAHCSGGCALTTALMNSYWFYYIRAAAGKISTSDSRGRHVAAVRNQSGTRFVWIWLFWLLNIRFRSHVRIGVSSIDTSSTTVSLWEGTMLTLTTGHLLAIHSTLLYFHALCSSLNLTLICCLSCIFFIYFVITFQLNEPHNHLRSLNQSSTCSSCKTVQQRNLLVRSNMSSQIKAAVLWVHTDALRHYSSWGS